MKEYISFDSHKHYTLMECENVRSGRVRHQRIEHDAGNIRAALAGCEKGSAVAVEATGNWYWILNEIEEAGMHPLLVHPRKAKMMMGMVNKTDKLDVHGLNVLQRVGTLPTVWVAPAPLRDLRELTRVRMVLCCQRTRLKNRLGATLAKYGRKVEASDAYAAGAREELHGQMEKLPPQTRWAAGMLLEQLDFISRQIQEQERRLKELLKVTPQMQGLMTLPGVGLVLSAAIALEIGDIERFASAPRLASYAGTTPRVKSSGDKTRYGQLRVDVNHYLKWAFAEAANSVAVNHKRCPNRHVSLLYGRLRQRKGHAKAIGAVARHLAEAAYWVLHRKENYREPTLNQGLSRKV